MNIVADIKSMVIGGEVNAISATELSKILGVKSNLTTWITRRIEKYKFQENFDYIKVVEEKDKVGRPSFELLLTWQKNFLW